MRPAALPDILHLWWLANPTQPQWVGTLRSVRKAQQQVAGVSLRYSPHWLQHGMALSEDLPLRDVEFLPQLPDSAVGAVDDARPDRWGERVIRFLINPQRLSTLDHLYFAGDDRFGALGVSLSSDSYQPFQHGSMAQLADVQQLHELIRQIEAGVTPPAHLARLVSPGATLGGAKPKALMTMDGAPWVLKFSEAHDTLDAGLVEHACMLLAAKAGITVCETKPLPYALGSQRQHALAVKRFDRAGPQRWHAVSAHVALPAAGMPHGYPEMALWLRRHGEASAIAQNAKEVFKRMVFNILMDNTDDHEKNHAFVWRAGAWHLAPAFDVLPTNLGLAYQSMRVGQEGADATLSNALSDHRAFGVNLQEAKQWVTQVQDVTQDWAKHFAKQSVRDADIQRLAQFIDLKARLLKTP